MPQRGIHLRTITFIVLSICFQSLTCAGDPKSMAGIEYFEKHVRPLLVTRCYSCHSVASKKREGGLTLDSKAGWTSGGENGPAIVPGDPEASLLIAAVRYDDPNLQMPPDKTLSPKSIEILETWVRMGAPDPRDKSVESTLSTSKPSDPVAGREHWAFHPLKPTIPPQVQNTNWPRAEIDRFILHELEQAGLSPAPEAKRRTLIRRTYQVLIGLPPSPQEVAEFLADDRENAFELVVDRLLATPQYGEHWGRHWLDLARYADSNGLDENFLFREAWRYRNWVISAVNSDMPYDQFLTEQIAGDLLPYDTIEQRDRQRIAAGFLVIGPKVLLGNNPNERIMDVADEQLDTIGKSVLGQTLGCARCHDHKFDPIPTADYYALAGIMTSTQVMETRYMLGQQRTMEQLIGLGESGEQADEAYETYWRQRDNLLKEVEQAKSALQLIEKADHEGLKKLAEKQKTVVAKVALDTERSLEDRKQAQTKKITELEEAAKPLPIPPRAMTPAEKEAPQDEAIRIAGQFNRPGELVPRGFLQVISDNPPAIPAEQSGRAELAFWLTDSQSGAGRLSARVLANRIWYHLFGSGIVRTVDNFGRTGEPPSHPELLDYLAGQLLEHDWSQKKLIKQIVLSRTFSMSSQFDASAYDRDPENRLHWRANKRRLSPEALRDTLLATAGTLDLTPMDSTVSYLGDQATAVGANKNRRRTDFPCRSVYLPVIRNDLPEVFEVFDFADPHATTGMRPETMVATQGLFLLNDATVMESANATANRILNHAEGASDAELVERAFELILSTPASAEERQSLLTFLHETHEHFVASGEAQPRVRAWSTLCHALFASSRFQIMD